jgi:hypothetical protein
MKISKYFTMTVLTVVIFSIVYVHLSTKASIPTQQTFLAFLYSY